MYHRLYACNQHTLSITIIQLSLTGSPNLAHLTLCHFLWPQSCPHLLLAGVWNQLCSALEFGCLNDPNGACLIGLEQLRGNHMYWISLKHNRVKLPNITVPAIKSNWGVSIASSAMSIDVKLQSSKRLMCHETHWYNFWKVNPTATV